MDTGVYSEHVQVIRCDLEARLVERSIHLAEEGVPHQRRKIFKKLYYFILANICFIF
jgi:hypothetical protein